MTSLPLAQAAEIQPAVARDDTDRLGALDWDEDLASTLDDLAGHSITYRVAVGPHRGQKAFTLQTLPAITEDDEPGELAAAGGFSLHAGIAAKANQRDKLERLCRYVARSAVADSRLSLTGDGRIRYSLKTPWRDGTTHVAFEPLDFIARLAALDCMDAGGRATQEQLPRSRGPALTSLGITGSSHPTVAGAPW